MVNFRNGPLLTKICTSALFLSFLSSWGVIGCEVVTNWSYKNIKNWIWRCQKFTNNWIFMHLRVFCWCFYRKSFKKVPLRDGITIFIHSHINDASKCWYRCLFCDIIFYHLLWPPPNPSTWGIYNASQMLYLLSVSLTLC